MVFIENAVLSVETDDILPALNLQVGEAADPLGVDQMLVIEAFEKVSKVRAFRDHFSQRPLDASHSNLNLH